MRPLSPEEVEQVTKSALRPLRWGLYFLLIPAAIFLIWILRSSLAEHWQSFLAPAIFFGLAFWMAWRKKAQIEADLATGFAETLTGEVEQLWRSKQENYIRVSGNSFRVGREAFRDLSNGEAVSVDYLPRSHIAVKVEPRSSA